MAFSLDKHNCERVRKQDLQASEEEIKRWLDQVDDWSIEQVNQAQRLTKSFSFKNFAQALHFANKVGEIAEAQDHHPMLVVEWGKITVSWWTHVIHGLHKNDFIMAAKTDVLFLSIGKT